MDSFKKRPAEAPNERPKKRLKEDVPPNCLVCSKIAVAPNEDGQAAQKITLGKDGWTFRNLETINFCSKLSLFKSRAAGEFPEGKWLLDMGGRGLSLAWVDSDGTTNVDFDFKKKPSTEPGGYISDFLGEELKINGQDWHVSQLEINETELCLELFKQIKPKFGGESWECLQEDKPFSVTMDVEREGLCERHLHDCPMVFERAPPPPNIQTIPDELLLRTFRLYKRKRGDLFTLARVCSRWRRIARDGTFWKGPVVITDCSNAMKVEVSVGGPAIKKISFLDSAHLMDSSMLQLVSESCRNLERIAIDEAVSLPDDREMLHLPDYWNMFFGTLENLKVFCIRLVEADGPSVANALSGVLSGLTALELPMCISFSDDEICRAFQGKSALTYIDFQGGIGEDHLALILDSSGARFKTFQTYDASQETGHSRLFDLELEGLRIRWVRADFAPEIGRLSSTLEHLDLDVSIDWPPDRDLPSYQEAVSSVGRLFGENEFRSLNHLCLTLAASNSLDPSHNWDTKAISWDAVFPLLVSHLSALESLYIFCAGRFPSLVSIFRLLNASCPKLQRFYLVPCEVPSSGNFWDDFKNPEFLPNLEALHVDRMSPAVGLGRVANIRPRMEVSNSNEPRW